MRKRELLVLISAAVLVISSVKAQSKTDFSGHWVLVTTPDIGRGGRGRGAGARGVTAVSTVSGAPINCGTECTILQNARTLTVSRPVNQNGEKPPDVVLNLDGSESTIIQSLDPPADYKADAKWEGGKLVVTRSMGFLAVSQTLSLEDGKLTVISTFSVEGDVPVALTYTRR